MATSAVRTPSTRRTSVTPSSQPSTPSSLRKEGATARSAVSPKVTASLNGRRGSVASKQSSIASNVEAEAAANAGLSEALKKETEEKEELLIRVQNKDQNIAELSSENSQLVNALNAAEARLTELYADQARFEEETAARLDLVERLRSQVQELEKEKRDILRRYNDQTATFDAERQSFYDNEQHLKSRIQSLVQARKTMESALSHKASVQTFSQLKDVIDDGAAEESSPVENASELATPTEDGKVTAANDISIEVSEPAELTAMRLELSTLSTSYASLQNTVQQMSAQLLDLKRVNNQLQEENESYNILLREKTLTGQYNIMKTAGARGMDEGSGDDEYDDIDEDGYNMEEQDSLRSRNRTPLEPVDEIGEEQDSTAYEDDMEQDTLVHDDSGSITSSKGGREHGRRPGRGGRRGTVSRSPPPKGESLAGLPVAGPGLDLAAELGRAENSAAFDGMGDKINGRERASSNAKGRKSKRHSMDRDGKLSSSNSGDVDALRNEVKSLKDANKALSLYASKIIDRIIAKEGFEHVLAADYEKPLASPTSPNPAKNSPPKEPAKKERPQSAIFGLSFTSSQPPPATPIQPTLSLNSEKAPEASTEKPATSRAQRRSMSFDWRGFSMFGSGEKKPDTNPNLKPLNLRPGASSVIGRKLDLPEDDEDRRERERLHATMKLMGIDKPMPSAPNSPAIGSPGSFGSSPSITPNPSSDVASPKPTQSRFSFFRSRSNTSDQSLGRPTSEVNLTVEALERREAETTLAALDEREKTLSAEIAKGANGGFTELPARRQRGEGRSRKSGMSKESGSGSTVWSAGMSTHIEESGDESTRV